MTAPTGWNIQCLIKSPEKLQLVYLNWLSKTKFFFLLFFTDMTFPNYWCPNTIFVKLRAVTLKFKMSFSRFCFQNSSTSILNYKLSWENRVERSLDWLNTLNWIIVKANRDLPGKLLTVVCYKSIISPYRVVLWVVFGLRVSIPYL